MKQQNEITDEVTKKLQVILSEVTGEEVETFTPDFDILSDLNMSPEELSSILNRINREFTFTNPLRYDKLKEFDSLEQLVEFIEEEGLE